MENQKSRRASKKDKPFVAPIIKKLVSQKALGFIAIDHPVRQVRLKLLKLFWTFSFLQLLCLNQACIRVEESHLFRTSMLVCIALNTIIMGLADYKYVNLETNELTATGSWQNELILSTELLFLVIYSIEMIVKIIAQGLYMGENTYLKVVTITVD
jgi:hypothetical protein